MKEQIPLIKQGWARALVFLLTWLMLQLGLNVLLFIGITRYFPEAGKENLNIYGLLAMSIVAMLANLLVVWIFRRNIDRKSFASLGFDIKYQSRHAYTGLLVAVLILALGTLVFLLAGNLEFIGIDFSATSLLLNLLLMAIIAISEEAVSRGYMLSNLMDSFPKWLALLISAIIFSLLHFFNPHFNLMSMLGIFSGGLLLGVNYIYTRNLWFGIAYHFAWNFLQGPILGYQVSGIETESLMVSSIHGANWWTGGPFGFEATLLSVVLNLGMAVFLYWWYNKKRLQKAIANQ